MTDAETGSGGGGGDVAVPLIPPSPVETELSRLQEAWIAAYRIHDIEGAASILASAAVEYVQYGAGSVGDGLGGGIVPIWGKAPRGQWPKEGMGGVGGRGPMKIQDIFEVFRLAGLDGADGIGVVCGAGLLVIDIDDWDAVPSGMWEVLATGLMVSSRQDPADRHAHVGWRSGPDDYVQSLSGFDGLGGKGWAAAGIGELRSAGGHIRIWGGGIDTVVAARDPQWFLDLPRAPGDLLDRLTVKGKSAVGGEAGDFYTADLFDWLDQHPLERVEEVCGDGCSDHNLETVIDWFHQALDEGLPKYTAALRMSLKLAADVAAEAVGGREAYDGLLEEYRAAGVAGGDWDEKTRVSAYNRMWRGAVQKILSGELDGQVRKSAGRVGNPLVRPWRSGLPAGEWTAELGIDPETGEILDDDGESEIGSSDNARGEDEAKPAGRLDPSRDSSSELAAHEPKVQMVQPAGELVDETEDIDEVIRRLTDVSSDGFMPSQQLLGADFWESRGVLDFIRRWAWTRRGWPDAVLMGLLAGLGAALPLELVIDPSRATPGPLSLFVLGIDQSGAGKSRNQTLAMRLLRELTGDFGPVALGRVIDLPLGTAEGVVTKFFQRRDASELSEEKADIKARIAARDKLTDEERADLEKQALADIEKYVRRIDGMVILADEAKSLIQLGELGGVGLLTMLLTAWSGRGGLVSTFKNTADLPQFKALSYRMSMNASIQTNLAHKLLGGEQADSGFAQRLLLFPLNDNWDAYEAWQDKLLAEWRDAGRPVHENRAVAGELAVEEMKDFVDLELAGGGGDRAWALPDWTRVKGLRTATDLEIGETWAMEIAEDCGYREARLTDERVRFKERAGDPLDAHTLFNQLRVAALMAVLDAGWKGARRDTVEISRQDWELAGKIIACTRANRSWLGRVAEAARRKANDEQSQDIADRQMRLQVHEAEKQDEGFQGDVLSHLTKFHDPDSKLFKGDVVCTASCWRSTGRSKPRQSRIDNWASMHLWVGVGAGSTVFADSKWFPQIDVPGLVRIFQQPGGPQGPAKWGAVLFHQIPYEDESLVIHPEDRPAEDS